MTDKNIKILFVDDDTVDQLQFKRFVKNEGLNYNYSIAGSLSEAIKIMGSEEFEIVVCDYNLGDGTAFELFPHISKYIPFIIITGLGDEEIAVKAMKMGAEDYLIKDPTNFYLKTLHITVINAIKNVQTKLELKIYRERLEQIVKERTRQINQQKELLENILNGLKDIVFMMDSDRAILHCNKPFFDMFNITPEELKGKKCYEVFEMTGICDACPVELSKINKKKETIEKFFPEMSSSFLCTSNPIMDGDGEIRLFVVELHDITEKKKSEQREKALEANMRQSQKMEAVGALAGGIVHDFNNILAAILMNTEQTMNYINKESIEFKYLENVIASCMNAKALTSHLIHFSRNSTSEKECIQLSSLIKESISFINAVSPKGVNMVLGLDSNDDMVLVNQIQISQILLNLCTNAVHAMNNKGTISIRTKKVSIDDGYSILLKNLKPGEYIKLTVSDTGCGIPSDILERIFEPYFTTKEPGKGSGLGLSVVYGIVKEHNGVITVYSELNKGTTFTIYFPIIKKRAKGESKTILPKSVGNEMVLLIDDEENIVKLMKMLLESLEYKVKCFTNPLEALKFFKADPNQFDVVITDKYMPEKEGQGLAEDILKIRPDIPVILCTGYDEIISEKMIKETGIKKL